MQPLATGLWPVMLTPFKTNNEVDKEGLQRLTNFYLDAGSNGLFANCLSSEMFQLTEKERLAITKTVVDTADGRVQVVATGSFSSDIQINADFIKKLYDTGVAAVVISTSQLVTEFDSDAVFKRKMEALLSQTGNIPLGLYECPVPYKKVLSPELLGWMAQTGRFLYHKDTCCSLSMLKQKLKAIEGTNMGLYNAHVSTGWDSLLNGARGLSPIGANFYPELFAYFLQHWKNGRSDEKLKKLDATLSIMDAVIHHNYPHIAKLFLQKRGLNISSESRISRTALDDDTHYKLNSLMFLLDQIAAELEIKLANTDSVGA